MKHEEESITIPSWLNNRVVTIVGSVVVSAVGWSALMILSQMRWQAGMEERFNALKNQVDRQGTEHGQFVNMELFRATIQSQNQQFTDIKNMLRDHEANTQGAVIYRIRPQAKGYGVNSGKEHK